MRWTLTLTIAACLALAGTGWSAEPLGPGPAAWADDLTPIGPHDWSYQRAAHLLERAGFGGTPEQIQRLLFRDGVIFLGVSGIQLVDDIPGHAPHRLGCGKRLGQLDLQRVDGSDVMHDDADFAPVLGDTGLPVLVREWLAKAASAWAPCSRRSARAFVRLLIVRSPLVNRKFRQIVRDGVNGLPNILLRTLNQLSHYLSCFLSIAMPLSLRPR